MIKKGVLSVAVAALLLTATAPAIAAETKSNKATHAFSSTTFSAPVKMSDAELAELNRSAVSVMPETNQFAFLYQPEAVSINWSYTGVFPGSYIDTQETYTVTADNEQVIIKACQYPDAIIKLSTAKATYQLVAVNGGQSTTPYNVTGNYTDSIVSFSFYNVQKGTYKLRISNVGSTDLAGNGFVYYY